jgi:hypothetical protein
MARGECFAPLFRSWSLIRPKAEYLPLRRKRGQKSQLNTDLIFGCIGISGEVRKKAQRWAAVNDLNGQLQPSVNNKKTYQEPRFSVYGDIKTTTQIVAVTGVPDGNNKGSVHRNA